MTIFINNIRRLSRHKSNYITLILLPVAFIFLSMFVFTSTRPEIKVGVYDEDKTVYTEYLTEQADVNARLVVLSDRNFQQALLDGKCDYILHFEKGFTSAVLNDPDGTEASQVKTYKIKETNQSGPFEYYMNGILMSTRNLAKASGGSLDTFASALERFQDPVTTVKYSNIEGADNERDKTRTSLGFVVMFIMFFASSCAALVLEDKELHTYERMLSTPVSLAKLYMSNIVSYFAVICLQIVLVIGMMVFFFKADFGKSPALMMAYLLAVGLMSVSLGVAISGISKSTRQADGLSTLIIVPLCMLGGCFWPVEIMSEFLRNLSLFNPIRWALSGVDKILYGDTVAGLSVNVGILLLFSVAFFLLGSSKKVAQMAKK